MAGLLRGYDTPRRRDMDARAGHWLGLVLLLWTAPAQAQELVWRPSTTAGTPPPADVVTLCRPTPLVESDAPPAFVVRAQAPEIPAPPPPPGVIATPPISTPPGLAGPTPYNCGQV